MTSTQEQEIAAPAISLDQVPSRWKELLNVFGQRGHKHLEAVMRSARAMTVEGNTITISFPAAFHKREIETNRQVVEEVLGQWVGQPVQVRGECENQPRLSTVSEPGVQYNVDSSVAKQQRAKSKSGLTIDGIRGKIISAFRSGNVEQARANLQVIRTRQATTPVPLSRSLAYIAHMISYRKIKRGLFDEAVALDPNNDYALAGLGRELANDKQMAQAREMFERALQINPNNAVTLSMYGAALTNNRQPQKACKMLERSLEIRPRDVKTLRNYGNALVATGQFEQAFREFERALRIKPRDAITFSSYGRALAKHGQLEKSREIFEQALQIRPRDSIIWTNYGKALSELGQAEAAFDKFKQALDINPDDSITLNSYSKALVEHAQFRQAFKLFDDSLRINPRDTVTLTSYGSALIKRGQVKEAIEKLERSLQIDQNDTATLNSYGKALEQDGQLDEAIKMFERSLQIRSENSITWTGYGSILAKHNEYMERAVEAYERAVQLDPDNIVSLTGYGTTLTRQGQGEKARGIFERALQIKPDDPVILFLYAALLEAESEYEAAIQHVEQIERDSLPLHFAMSLCLILGRLYYLIKQEQRGDEYFEEAIKSSPRAGVGRIRAARNILVIDPHSEEAIERLQQITPDSPGYTQAQRMLAISVSMSDYFELVRNRAAYRGATDELSDIDVAMVNRAIYHKIQNEISLLKIRARRIASRDESITVLTDIIENIEATSEEITRRRNRERAQVEQIPADDYEKIIETISQTAHDIVDLVNNELATIKIRLRRVLKRLSQQDPSYQAVEKLLTQVEFTEVALNDLKSVNQGVEIKCAPFKVQELYEIWQATPQLRNATIVLDIQNAGSEFDGDKQKIKSFLSELVENSLKHNPDQDNLVIQIISRDINGLPPHVIGSTRKRMQHIPTEKKYLSITLNDNGQGVSSDKKEWIFLPLKTTLQDSSGLGLFIIRRTLRDMRGYIIETGSQGATFELYIPYGGRQ